VINDAVWQTFIQAAHTVGADKREYPEWHKGRSRYYVWVVDIDDALVLSRVHKAKLLFEQYTVSPYVRQPHITLAVSGFLVDHKYYNDDVVLDILEQQYQAIKILNLSCFTLQVAGVNSFLSAPYLEVVDRSNSLYLIRNALNNVNGEIRFENYVPHITIGIYNDAYAISDLIEIPCFSAKLSPLDLKIKKISLMSYDACDIGSLLQEEKIIFL
jgi:2'-5' RNA ligase